MNHKKIRIAWNKGLTKETDKRIVLLGKKSGKSRKGKKLSEEHIKKLSLANKGRVPPNKGKKCSLEIKKKISIAMTGRKLSKEHRKNLINCRNNYTHSQETRKKISQKLTGLKRSDETKRKMSLAQKIKYIGKNNPLFGRHLSKEHKKKLSLTNKGRIVSEKTRKKISLSNKGKKRSEEFKRKMTGRKLSNSHRKKISIGHLGKKLSDETKKKLSLSLKGRKYPIELYPNKGTRNFVFPKTDTSIELKIQKYLSELHIEYVTHKYISEITHSYQCDIFIPEQEIEGVIIPQKTVIECDGCFFHCCPKCKNKEYYWTLERRRLDEVRTQELKEKGFRVIRLWEHEINKMELNEFKEKLINTQ